MTNNNVMYLSPKKVRKITSLIEKANDLASKGLSWTKASDIIDNEIERFCKENGIDENDVWNYSFEVEE